jgi:hypothetical protein
MAGKLLFTNQATSRLRFITDAASPMITLAPGDGAQFPMPSGEDYFLVVIDDRRTGQFEIAKCVSRTDDFLTVIRGQEGTVAQNFPVGAIVSNRITAGTMEYLHDIVENAAGYSELEADEKFVDITGDIMIGPLKGVPPVDNEDFTTKLYVDNGLGTKAPSVHTHAISDVTNLPAELANRPTEAASDGTIYGRINASWQQITWDIVANKPGTFPPTLPIPISGVSGLQVALDSKIGEAPNNGKQYARQNLGWAETAAATSVSDTPPANPLRGQLWWDSDSGDLMIWYIDANTSQWVSTNGISSGAYLPIAGGTMTGQIVLPSSPAPVAANAVRKDYVDGAANLKVAKTGDTMSGDLAIAKASPTLIINKSGSGQHAGIQFQNNGVMRWWMIPSDATPEGGDNSGSDFALHRYANNGAHIGQAFTIYRATGNASFGTSLTVGGALGVGTTLNVNGAATFYTQPVVYGGAPTMAFSDSNWGVRYVHCNDGVIGFLSHAGGWTQQFHNDGSATFMANVVIGSATYTTDGNIYMPWAADWLSNVLGSKSVNGASATHTTLTLTNTSTAINIVNAGYIYAHGGVGPFAYFDNESAATGTSYIIFRHIGSICGSIGHPNSVTTAYYTSSDGRLKPERQDFDADEILDATKVVKHNWLNPDDGWSYGVIAQDEHPHFPQAFQVGSPEGKSMEDEDFQPWSADYAKYVPLLIKGRQQDKARIAALEGAVEELRAMVLSMRRAR